MGLFGFMIAAWMLGAWQAGLYGSASTPLIIWARPTKAIAYMQSMPGAHVGQ